MRKDHCWSIMLGGLGPGSVALFSIIAFDSRKNSYARATFQDASDVCQLWIEMSALEAGRQRMQYTSA